MNIKCGFELSMMLDTEKFQDAFDKYFRYGDDPEEDGSEFTDRSMADEGLIVCYRASQLKKRIRITVDTTVMTGNALLNSKKLLKRIEKLVLCYFDSEYRLRDFVVSGMILAADLHVGTTDELKEYLRVLQRIGKVKGYSPVECEYLEDNSYFHLVGNSNATTFLVYGLAQAIVCQLGPDNMKKKQLQAIIQENDRTLRIEIQLTKPKAIRRYTTAYSAEDQLVELAEKSPIIFMEVFSRVIPYGDFFKKRDAVDILRREVRDVVARRRMLRLLTLIPEKKSLHLAQKAMAYRHPDDLLIEFAKINLSPVTIGKRQKAKHLRNLYELL